MGASRFPGKVLADVSGKPALGRMIDRLYHAESLDGIIIATSVEQRDDRIATWARKQGLECYRGSELDVLDRVVKAQRSMNSDVVVELCGDCPLIEPEVIDRAVERFLVGDCDLVTTIVPQSYPQGFDVEVFSLNALENFASAGPNSIAQEHVSSPFYLEPDSYKIVNLDAPPDLRRPNLRLLLDYPQDLIFLSEVYAALDKKYGKNFSGKELLQLIESETLVPFDPTTSLTAIRQSGSQR